ncbi:hypothetical protein [Enterovirga sp.]|uniref:hypothetical protein n=1 Tax=Enterovirga sp. TaxID=2026350 RepID=UPI002B613A04|nr:hypothetical protein [Enterovirga sp.]HMO30401.1 hypothetical protein [Enterovirga sp.]
MTRSNITSVEFPAFWLARHRASEAAAAYPSGGLPLGHRARFAQDARKHLTAYVDLASLDEAVSTAVSAFDDYFGRATSPWRPQVRP